MMAVRQAAAAANLQVEALALGEMKLSAAPTTAERQHFAASLAALGFELIDDKRSRVIEQVKNTVRDWVHHSIDNPGKKLSTLLAEQLHLDYNYLSNLFSETEGITIEKYYISQKIEKAKELLMYDELSLSEIAFRLGYSSTAYLSNQFKKETGLTPGFYKKLKDKNRRSIDDL